MGPENLRLFPSYLSTFISLRVPTLDFWVDYQSKKNLKIKGGTVMK